MKKFNVIVTICIVLVFIFGCANLKTTSQNKYVIILQADTDRHEGMARAVHALMYGKESLESDFNVVLIFDDAGTGWAKEMRNPEHKLYNRYMEIVKMGVVEEICDFCAGAFQVKDNLLKSNDAPLMDDYYGHPSIVTWIHQGYSIIVL